MFLAIIISYKEIHLIRIIVIKIEKHIYIGLKTEAFISYAFN